MGVVTSSVNPNPKANEVIHGIYKPSEYKWKQGQIASNIRKSNVTPILPYTTESQLTSRCFCSICYNYYPMINETTCCEQGICTECLAVIIDPPPKERICPYCRNKNIEIRSCVEYNNLKHPVVMTEEPLLNIDQNLPDDINCILLQYENANRQAVIDLYKAGISAEDIVQNLC